jgi:hypothetical protein
MATPPCLAKPPLDLDDPMPQMLGRHASHDLMIHTHVSAWACMQATTAPEMLGHHARRACKPRPRGAAIPGSVLNRLAGDARSCQDKPPRRRRFSF